jgi:hypothetical protein
MLVRSRYESAPDNRGKRSLSQRVASVNVAEREAPALGAMVLTRPIARREEPSARPQKRSCAAPAAKVGSRYCSSRRTM